MSETPRTDSQHLWHGELAVNIEFARQLERELAQARLWTKAWKEVAKKGRMIDVYYAAYAEKCNEAEITSRWAKRWKAEAYVLLGRLEATQRDMARVQRKLEEATRNDKERS